MPISYVIYQNMGEKNVSCIRSEHHHRSYQQLGSTSRVCAPFPATLKRKGEKNPRKKNISKSKTERKKISARGLLLNQHQTRQGGGGGGNTTDADRDEKKVFCVSSGYTGSSINHGRRFSSSALHESITKSLFFYITACKFWYGKEHVFSALNCWPPSRFEPVKKMAEGSRKTRKMTTITVSGRKNVNEAVSTILLLPERDQLSK